MYYFYVIFEYLLLSLPIYHLQSAVPSQSIDRRTSEYIDTDT